jgi:hypothetical protein
VTGFFSAKNLTGVGTSKVSVLPVPSAPLQPTPNANSEVLAVNQLVENFRACIPMLLLLLLLLDVAYRSKLHEFNHLPLRGKTLREPCAAGRMRWNIWKLRPKTNCLRSNYDLY